MLRPNDNTLTVADTLEAGERLNDVEVSLV